MSQQGGRIASLAIATFLKEPGKLPEARSKWIELAL
jgi:hypothetical protein